MFKNIFKKADVEIIKIKSYKESVPDWAGTGIVFYVKNGKGLLAHKYGYLENDALSTLVYGNVPLVKFHGDGPYFCPTCEKLVSAGYGLDMSDDKLISNMREQLNSKFTSLDEALERLEPLFGILPTGYYAIVDTELCPTNGNGEFFWNFKSVAEYNKASCPIYGGDGLWSSGIPYYILPTQSPKNFNSKQADFYKNNEGYQAIAYHLDGYLCALLDGHHKAVAAAIQKRKVKSLVIIPATSVWEANKRTGVKGGISINGVSLSEDELITSIDDVKSSWGANKLTEGETKKYIHMINSEFGSVKWKEEILECEKVFPDALTVARIEWAGGISDERLNKILKNEEKIDDKDALNISTALYYSNNIRFKEISFHFCRNQFYSSVWYKIYELIANIKDEGVENFFVEFLINDEGKHKDIKSIVDKYFQK